MPAFAENPWLLWLGYLVAACAVAYAIQLQLSMREGAKPVRGMMMWREDLQGDLAMRLRVIAEAETFRSNDAKGATLDTTITPEAGGLFVHVRRMPRNGAPAPYNGTIGFGGSGAWLGVRLSPLIPLIYVGLGAFIFGVFGAGWFAWVFALGLVTLFLMMIAHTRSVLMEALREVSG